MLVNKRKAEGDREMLDERESGQMTEACLCSD